MLTTIALYFGLTQLVYGSDSYLLFFSIKNTIYININVPLSLILADNNINFQNLSSKTPSLHLHNFFSQTKKPYHLPYSSPPLPHLYPLRYKELTTSLLSIKGLELLRKRLFSIFPPFPSELPLVTFSNLLTCAISLLFCLRRLRSC